MRSRKGAALGAVVIAALAVGVARGDDAKGTAVDLGLPHVNGFAVAPGGKLAAASSKGKIVLWNLAGSSAVWTYVDPEAVTPIAFGAVAFTQDGKRFAVTSNGDPDALYLFDTSSATPRKVTARISGSDRIAPDTVAFSPDGRWLVASGSILALDRIENRGNAVVVWDASSGAVATRIEAPGPAAFSPDGKTLAVLGPDMQRGSISLRGTAGWGETTSVKLVPDEENTGEHFSASVLTWTPDGKTIVAAGSESGLAVVDPASSKVRFVKEHVSSACALAWSPDGKLLAVARGSDPAALFTPDGTFVAELAGGAASVSWRDAKTVLFLNDNDVSDGGGVFAKDVSSAGH